MKFDSSSDYRWFRLHANRAKERWRRLYPGVPCHINTAYEEYAEEVGLPINFFHGPSEMHPSKRLKRIRSLTCPLCGRLLQMESLPGCPHANPNRYSFIAYCWDESEADQCSYHAYIVEGAIDALNKIEAGLWDEVQKIEVN